MRMQDSNCSQLQDDIHCELFLHTCNIFGCNDTSTSHLLRFIHATPPAAAPAQAIGLAALSPVQAINLAAPPPPPLQPQPIARPRSAHPALQTARLTASLAALTLMGGM